MKKNLLLFLALTLGLLSHPIVTNGMESTGEAPADKSTPAEAHMTLPAFTSIANDVVANIVFKQCAEDTYRVSAVGPERIIRLIDIKVKEGTLHITAPDYKMRNGEKLSLTIEAPVLRGLQVDGVGNFKVPSLKTTEPLSIINNGVGNIEIEYLQGTEVSIDLHGVGNVEVEGTCQKLSLSSDGVGNIDVEDLHAVDVAAKLDGVGSIECWAGHSFEAMLNGVGSIRYHGNPEVTRIKKRGPGSIKAK